MTRLKLIAVTVGVCLLVWVLTGARGLQSPDGAGTPPPPAGGKKPADSLVQAGTVDTDARPVAYLLPAHLPAATVAEVLVKDGDKVTAGQVLVRFDAELAKRDLDKATAAHAAALWQQKTAQTAVDTYTPIDEAKLAAEDAEAKLRTAREARDTAARRIDETNSSLQRTTELSAAKAAQNRKDELFKFDVQVEEAERNVRAKKLDQTKAEAGKTRYEEAVKAAAALVSVAVQDVAKAKLAVERCELKAVSAGTAERVDAAPGQTVGPYTRSPLVLVVPDGDRVVRVEVVPDFAYRLQDKLDKPVTIADEQVPGNTYPGKVVRIPTAFLPRRAAGPELLAGKPTTVLEVVVQVLDLAPAGKPPLRVGQPVRVHFP